VGEADEEVDEDEVELRDAVLDEMGDPAGGVTVGAGETLLLTPPDGSENGMG